MDAKPLQEQQISQSISVLEQRHKDMGYMKCHAASSMEWAVNCNRATLISQEIAGVQMTIAYLQRHVTALTERKQHIDAAVQVTKSHLDTFHSHGGH